MKVLILVLLLVLSSCSSQKSKINRLSKQVEKRSDVKLLVKEESLPVFKERNVVLRNKIIDRCLNQIKENKKEFFYLIENYNYDWGGIYTVYLIVGEKTFCFQKQNALRDYDEEKCYLYELEYKSIVPLLNDKRYADAKAKFFIEENCLSVTNIFVITKNFKIVESLTGLHCLEPEVL